MHILPDALSHLTTLNDNIKDEEEDKLKNLTQEVFMAMSAPPPRCLNLNVDSFITTPQNRLDAVAYTTTLVGLNKNFMTRLKEGYQSNKS